MTIWNTAMWGIQSTSDYEARRAKFEKKHAAELMAVLLNLKRLHLALNAGAKLLQVKFGFFRSERSGVYRISQQGQGRALKETRLYVYPDEAAQTLYCYVGERPSRTTHSERWVEKSGDTKVRMQGKQNTITSKQGGLMMEESSTDWKKWCATWWQGDCDD